MIIFVAQSILPSSTYLHGNKSIIHKRGIYNLWFKQPPQAAERTFFT